MSKAMVKNGSADYGSFHRRAEDGMRTPKEDRRAAATTAAVRRFPWSAPAQTAFRPGHQRVASSSCPIIPNQEDLGPHAFRTSSEADAVFSDCDTPSHYNNEQHKAPLIKDADSGNMRRKERDSGQILTQHEGAGDMGGDAPTGHPLLSNDTQRPFFNAKGSECDKSEGEFTVIDFPPHDEYAESRTPKERWKTLLAMLFFMMCAVINMMSLAIIHDRVPPRERGALPDIILDHIYTSDWALYVAEYLLMVLTYFCVLLCFFHVHRWVVFRRCFFLLGLLYLYRSVTMFVTVLPVASPTYICKPQSNETTVLIVLQRTGELLLGMGLSVNGYHQYCGDYLYSGHTMILVIGALIVREYTPKSLWPLHWFTYLWSAVGIFMVLFSRGHYTVDVIVAYYITTRLFWAYHTLANVLHPLKLGPDLNLIGRAWWYPMFSYMEKNVESPLPKGFSSPIPFGRCWVWLRTRFRPGS